MTASIERRSPLAGSIEAFARASRAPEMFAIRELPLTTQVNLRGNAADAAFASAVRGVLGCDLPTSANTFTAASARHAIWLGPSEWLIVDDPDRGDEVVTALRSALAGTHHSVTDVSAARTVIEISGAHARLVLAKGCPLDLQASAFAPPRVAQTLLAKARVLFQCVDERPAFRLFVLDSFAAYLAQWLTDAALECAASRALDMDRVAARLA